MGLFNGPKKIHIAFVWHMHQPVYKDVKSGEYIMPWVRFHAIKDYLDMLLILEEFPSIKLNFNLSSLLLEQVQDYAENNAHDTHSRLTVTDVEELTDDDKAFILDSFFDANFSNMILPHENFLKLYEKRFNNENVTIQTFSNQEYADIMAWFNMIWFDPYWLEVNKELKALYDKGLNYTLEDRIKIIDIQRDIMKQIIPTYKKMWESQQIEISTSPYYHPILPLLIDMNSAKEAIPSIELPNNTDNFAQDAKVQVEKSLAYFEKIFGQKPKGMWPSEQCISPETLKLLSQEGIKWTIADEGILAKTIDCEFIRDFRGVIEDPYSLCLPYKYKKDSAEISLFFRDAVASNLIGFEYGNHEPEVAANDLYERIKIIQSKLQASPEKQHIFVIAMDGENCWESHQQDGRPFLKNLYSLLSDDSSIETVTLSDYIENTTSYKPLDNIHSGSWINRSFQLWVGDPIKNLAWDYLNKTRNDLIEFSKEDVYPKATLEKAWSEIYISQGSDWFWWYGEPNNSGQDELFDSLFRSHLQNVYILLKKQIPPYLSIPLETFIGKPLRVPSSLLSPKIDGKLDNTKWQNAGCIELPQNPMQQSNKPFKRMFFCNDENNIYFRFDVNEYLINELIDDMHLSEVCVYFAMPENVMPSSKMRLRTTNNTNCPTQKTSFSYELELGLSPNKVIKPIFSEVTAGGLWKLIIPNSINYVYSDVLELSIPFDDLKVKSGQDIHFAIAIAKSQILQEIVPQNMTLSLRRP